MNQLDFGFKFCTNCKTEKLLTDFYVQTSNKDGLANYCIGCKKQIYKQTYDNFKDKNSERSRQYYSDRKDKVREQRKTYYQSAYYKLSTSLRDKFDRLVNRNDNTLHPLFNISGESIRSTIETKFENGMSWDNRGSWKLVFIKRISTFDLKNKQEILLAFSPENVKPVWK